MPSTLGNGNNPHPGPTLVAALTRGRVIGAEGGIPWHLPEDLRHFKQLTTGATVIMGRGTFDSIGRALPGRRTIVITRSPTWSAPGVETAGSVDEALERAAPEQIFIAGGAQIYALALPRADRMVLSHVHLDVPGDTYFPEWDPAHWRVVQEQAYDGFTVVTYERTRPEGPAAG